MAYLRETIGGWLGWLPLSWLQNLAGTGLIVPLYHAVADLPLPHIQPLYPIRSTERFKVDIDWIQGRYRSITLRELTEQIHLGQPFRKPSFHLTFDDALRQVLPLSRWLREQGISATLFVNPDFIGNHGLMHRYKAALLISRIEQEENHRLREQLANMLGCSGKEVVVRLLS